MSALTIKELEAIKQRAEKATEGPWKTTPLHQRGRPEPSGYLVTLPDAVSVDYPLLCKTNAEFIAASRTDVPALVAEVERLKKEVAEYKNTLVRIANVAGIYDPSQLIALAENGEETYADVLVRHIEQLHTK